MLCGKASHDLHQASLYPRLPTCLFQNLLKGQPERFTDRPQLPDIGVGAGGLDIPDKGAVEAALGSKFREREFSAFAMPANNDADTDRQAVFLGLIPQA